MEWRLTLRLVLIFLFLVGGNRIANSQSRTQDWNEFRGPNGRGVHELSKPPVTIDVANATWMTEIPPGHASPVLAAGRLFVTANDDGTLMTIALDSRSGEILWQQTAPTDATERVHEASSQAASTACVDGERLYVYFGSYGLICYDFEGNTLWEKPIATPRTLYGMSSSPVVHENKVILVLDNDANQTDSQLDISQSKIIALDKLTGEPVWESPRPLHRSGWSTPTIWSHGDTSELVVLGNGRVRGYNLEDGAEKWSVAGFSRETIARPIVGDGVIFVAASMLGGVADDRPDPEPFWQAIIQFDENGDDKLQRDEMKGHFTWPFRPDLPAGHPGFGMPLPSDPERRAQRLDGMFSRTDKNKDGFWTKEEFLGSISFDRGKPNLLAIEPGGDGDVTESHVKWALHRCIPEVPTPVLYQGRIYLVRDGGVLSSIDATDGRILYQGRLNAPGHARASPVIANEHLYTISQEGLLSVVRTGDDFEIVHQFDFAESVSATPALDEETIYIRTDQRLMAFRKE